MVGQWELWEEQSPLVINWYAYFRIGLGQMYEFKSLKGNELEFSKCTP